MSSRVSKSLIRVFAVAIVGLLPVALAAQDTAKPAAKPVQEDSATRWDIFAGYSYIAPHGTIVTPEGGLNQAVPYSAITGGGIVSVARYFNRFVGVEGVGDVHTEDESQNPWVTSKDDISSGAVGLIFRYPTSDITPLFMPLWAPTLLAGRITRRTNGARRLRAVAVWTITPRFSTIVCQSGSSRRITNTLT